LIPPRPKGMHRGTYARPDRRRGAGGGPRRGTNCGFDVEALRTKVRITSRPRMPGRRHRALQAGSQLFQVGGGRPYQPPMR
jgi:hypothetical protein